MTLSALTIEDARNAELYGGLISAYSIWAQTWRRPGQDPIHAPAGDVGVVAGWATRQGVCRSALPDWLPDVTLTDFRLGRRRFDIRFCRDGKDTVFRILKGKPDVVERMSIALSGRLADR
jgi:hypothetical protein